MSKPQHLLRKICLAFALLAGLICLVILVLFLTGILPPNQQNDDQTTPVSTTNSEPAPPSEEELLQQAIQKTIDQMTLEEKVGQMVVARCPSVDAAEKASQYHLGGYILFAQDFANQTESEIQQTIQSYQSASTIPMFIAVDEEGGIVNRASLNPNLRSEPFQSPQTLYQLGGLDLISSDATEKSNFLKNLGVNLNFAPVSDVSTDPSDFIYDRSFGQPADATAEYVKTVVSAMKSAQIGSVLKHFPGYGNNVDTHSGVAYDNRPYSTFQTSDFLPFEAGIAAGANVILVAHNVVASIDPNLPASISAPAHQILRNDLNFDGLIITDDLVMDGVRSFAGDEAVAVMAVEAGNDLLCSTDFEVQIPALLEAVQTGQIPESRLDESLIRILKTKHDLGLIEL